MPLRLMFALAMRTGFTLGFATMFALGKLAGQSGFDRAYLEACL